MNLEIVFEDPIHKFDDMHFVMIDVKSLDDAWQSDPFYIRSKSEGNSKYAEALDYICNLKSCASPHIGLDSEGKVGFFDGRHRFAVLRDLGLKSIKVAVSKEDYSKIKRLFEASVGVFGVII